MFDLVEFEGSARENGIRYWLANDYMASLGYESWQSFQAVIRKAQASCLQLDIPTEDVFVPVTLEDGSKSFKLTRFACYLVAMNADNKKPDVARAQVILAGIAEQLVNAQLSEGSIGRIEERGKLTAAERLLGGVAKAAGVESDKFGVFKDAGIRGMYNMSLRDLREYKNAPDAKSPLYDFMGLTELAANTFRVTQTAARLQSSGASGLHQVSRAATEVGRDVRQVMIRSSGVAPENLALEGHIDKTKSLIKQANKKMIKHDAMGKPVKKPKPGNGTSDASP